MIQTKQELKEYIEADRSRYNISKNWIINYVTRPERYLACKYLKCLRYTEYYYNIKSRRRIIGRIMYYLNSIRLRRLSSKYNIHIGLNVVGKGLYIPHIAGGVIINALHLGDYCVVNTGVVIGIKGSQYNKPTIGNYVEITVGAKIIGKITIGDYAAIAPNSVVISDIPAYSIVSGVPAKIIKYKPHD